MQELNSPTFAVFFSVNQEDASVRRFVLLRQFLEADYGDEIKILDYTSLVFGLHKFLVIAEADCLETIENALTHCRGIVETQIRSVSRLEINPTPTEKRYAVFAALDETKKSSFTRNPETLLTEVNLQIRAEFEMEETRLAVLLLDAPSTIKARQYGEMVYPQARIFVTETVSPQTLVSNSESCAETSETSESEPALNETAEVNFDGSSLSLFNEGASAVAIAPEAVNGGELDYYGLFKNITNLPSQQAASFNTGCYVWSSVPGQLNFDWQFFYTVLLGNHGGGKTYNQDIKIQFPTNAPVPTLYTLFTPGVNLGFDLGTTNGFHARTPQYFWLNDILNSTKYDADFPEKSYTGDDLAAYNYFVGKLQAEPWKGNVPSSIMQGVIDEGCPPSVNPQAFRDVGSHLIFECSYFETADKWFGLNGIFSVINTQISEVASNDLTAAAALMQIQDPTQNIMTTLGSIFSIFESIVSIIPVYGSAISAVMNIGWSAAQLAMGGPSVTNAPIEESIANMADKINSYLSNILKANAQNHQTIGGNWGKLKAFAEGATGDSPIITESQFGITYTGEGNVKLPQNYIDAAIIAWKIVVYQMLFAGFHTPLCNMTTQSSKPGNPWNPDAGNYEYVFSLDCIYPDSNGNPTKGFMAFDCTTNAPTEVLKVLFGKDSDLNLNPLMFFAGFNGWKANYLFNQGEVSYGNVPSSPPFSQFGIIN